MTICSSRILPTLILAVGLLPVLSQAKQDAGHSEAVFAGGCFWCLEQPFDDLDGVISTTPGYTGGMRRNPTYRQVATGRTAHIEALRVVYDPDKVSYEELLEVFWVNVDPTDAGGQFCDRGRQYRSEIFYLGEEQRRASRASLAKLEDDRPFGGAITTRLTPATTFWPAEHKHQDYYRKNPLRYRYYRYACGRDARLEAVWGDRAPTPSQNPFQDQESEESGFSGWLSGLFGFFSS